MNRSIAALTLLALSPLDACLLPSTVASQDGAQSVDATSPSDSGSSPTTVPVQTCAAGPTNQSMGIGYNAVTPGQCVAARGPDHPVASIAELSSLLVGTWTSCYGSPFGAPQPSAASAIGIELRADGSYQLLTRNDRWDLANDVPVARDAGPDTAAHVGTYEVVDGSATFGPGTYAIRLHPSEGGASYGQIVVSDSPRIVHFFAPGATDTPLAPSLPWSAFSPTCQCVETTGTVGSADPAMLGAALVGRWLGCDGIVGFGETASVGLEFDADGTWYSLMQDQSGGFVRGPRGLDHGTYHAHPGSALELARDVGGNLQTQAFVTTSPRSLRIAVGTMTDGTGTHTIFATMMPLQ